MHDVIRRNRAASGAALLVLTHGRQYLVHQAGPAIVIDLMMALLFIGYLIGAPKSEDGLTTPETC